MVDCAQNRAKRPLGDFAIPRLRALPYKINGKIVKECVRAAMARWNQVKDATAEEKKKAKAKLIAAAKKVGIDVGKFADEKGKEMNWSLGECIKDHIKAHLLKDKDLHLEAVYALMDGYLFDHEMKDELDEKLPFELRQRSKK